MCTTPFDIIVSSHQNLESYITTVDNKTWVWDPKELDSIKI